MSGTAAPKHEWLVIMPDFEGALEKRLSVRAQHFKELKPKIDAGVITFGGASLAHHPTPSDGTNAAPAPAPMNGSVFVVRASSESEARSIIEDDIYTKAGAWNVKKATFMPFKTAIATAVEPPK